MSRPATPSERDWIDYLDDSMGPNRRTAFDTWLAGHPEAVEELADLQRLYADVTLLPLPHISDRDLDDARRRVLSALPGLAEVTVGQGRQPGLRRMVPWAWIPASVAALALGVLLGRGSVKVTGLPLEADLIDGHGDLFQRVDGVVETGVAGPPRRRHVDIQDLAVDAEQGVRILLRETSSYEINGTTADRNVQNTLSFIVRNDRDPLRRQTAIQLLERHCSGQDVCQVLIYAMTQDPVAAVRREAALALQDDRQDDMVHGSFIKMLMEDPSPELRQLARGVLSSGEAESKELGR